MNAENGLKTGCLKGDLRHSCFASRSRMDAPPLCASSPTPSPSWSLISIPSLSSALVLPFHFFFFFFCALLCFRRRRIGCTFVRPPPSQVAAANAMTVLCRSGYSFAGMDLSRIKVRVHDVMCRGKGKSVVCMYSPHIGSMSLHQPAVVSCRTYSSWWQSSLCSAQQFGPSMRSSRGGTAGPPSQVWTAYDEPRATRATREA